MFVEYFFRKQKYFEWKLVLNKDSLNVALKSKR